MTIQPDWAVQVLGECIVEADGNVALALAAAGQILALHPIPMVSVSIEAAFNSFDPNQPRKPKGDPEGGQWVTVSGYTHPATKLHLGGFHGKVARNGIILNGKL